MCVCVCMGERGGSEAGGKAGSGRAMQWSRPCSHKTHMEGVRGGVDKVDTTDTVHVPTPPSLFLPCHIHPCALLHPPCTCTPYLASAGECGRKGCASRHLHRPPMLCDGGGQCARHLLR